MTGNKIENGLADVRNLLLELQQRLNETAPSATGFDVESEFSALASLTARLEVVSHRIGLKSAPVVVRTASYVPRPIFECSRVDPATGPSEALTHFVTPSQSRSMITDVWSDLRVIVDRWLRRDFRRLIADAPPIDVVNGDAHQHGDAGSFPTMPKEAGIEEPTRAVSLTYAAEQWFNSTRKALKSELGRTLRVCRIGVNGKKWIFDREQLQERLQGGERYKAIMDDADPATTERTYPRRP